MSFHTSIPSLEFFSIFDSQLSMISISLKKNAIKSKLLNVASTHPPTSTHLLSSVSIYYIFSSVNLHELPYFYLNLIPPLLGSHPYFFSYSRTVLQNITLPPVSWIFPLYWMIPINMQPDLRIFFILKIITNLP